MSQSTSRSSWQASVPTLDSKHGTQSETRLAQESYGMTRETSPRSRHLFGFVELKADYASFLAFLVAVVAGIYQLYWFARGPELELLAPQQVFFNHDKTRNTRFIVPVTLRNRALPQYSGVIETVDLFVPWLRQGLDAAPQSRTAADGANGEPDTVHQFRWTHEMRSNPLADPKHVLVFVAAAAPLLVGGSSAVSHEYEFKPVDKWCADGQAACANNIIVWEELIAMLEDVDELELMLVATDVDGSEYRASCTLVIDANFTSTTASKEFLSPPCKSALIGG